MYARLWWKEMRVFWPIWPALGLVAAGVQWFLLWSKVPEARIGLLILLGLVWSLLHAFAVGAGVFAAESEAKTQIFLDTLPVSRRMLWKSKVSFALASTFGVALVLAALGTLGTGERDLTTYSDEIFVWGYGVLLLEAVAWSLLWSVVLGSALQAAVLGMVTISLLSVLHLQRLNLWQNLVPTSFVVPRLALAGAAFGASWLVFTRGPRRDRSTWVPVRTARADTRFGRLVWETVRESSPTWVVLTVAWGGLIVAWLTHDRYRPDSQSPWAYFGTLACALTAGVSVFGPANRTRSYRFLAYHGVRPGLVWTAKLTVWGGFIATLLLVMALALMLGWRRSDREFEETLKGSFVIVETFVVAILAGQVLRRSITAWVVAFLALFLLVMPQVALYAANMIPMAGLAIFPLLVLAISRSWTGDWMNDLRGNLRWLRLAALFGSAAFLMVALYIGYRAWSVPDLGSPFPLRPAAPPPVAIRPDQDAAPDYTRILTHMKALDRVWPSGESTGQQPSTEDLTQMVTNLRQSQLEPTVAWWTARRALIEPIRQAAAKPEARFPPQVFLTSGIDPRIAELGSVVTLLGVDNFHRRSEGDLTAAWDDLLTVFRMAAQIDRIRGLSERTHALFWRAQALKWALAWAGDPHQTPAQLRSALASFHALPKLAPIADSLEAEYRLEERTLLRDPEVLIDLLAKNSVQWAFMRKLIAPWWERERAVRVLRIFFAQRLRFATREPWEQLDDHLFRKGVDWCLASTPLIRALPEYSGSPLDENVLLARAFEQVAALRIWQLEHDGRYPETLQALVPGLLPRLPADPYSGKPYRYRQSGWFLYSVGPDGEDDDARLKYERNNPRDDVIFPLPPPRFTTTLPQGVTRSGAGSARPQPG